MAEKLNVAVIGGGYAGMAAATELAAQDVPVTVFESAKQPGGRARGVEYNDIQLDNGQHLLLGCYRETLRLIERVGGDIETDFLRLPLQLDLHRHLELRAPRLPSPFHLLAALFQAHGLGWAQRIKAARFMLTLRRANFHLNRLPLPPGDGGGGGTRDITVSKLLTLNGQDADLTLKLWEPLTLAALNTPIHKASAQVLLNVLRDALNRKRADSDMLLPRLDLGALFPQRAAEYVARHGGTVRLSCAVESVVVHPEGFELSTAQGRQHFSQVICAVAPGAAARLLCPLPGMDATAQQIAALEQQPIYTVYLQYPAHVTLPHPMIGLHRRCSQWLFDKGRIAGQNGLLAAVISAEGIHQQLAQEELAQRVISELREEFAIVQMPHWFKVIAEKRATFCCAPNLQRPPSQTPFPGLWLAGDYVAGDYPATLEGAVISGVAAARLAQDRSGRM
ncbi:MAG: hydroxysqualene dehydroxylase HpnE [Sideroxydans sp.]